MVSIAYDLTDARLPQWIGACIDPKSATTVFEMEMSWQHDRWQSLKVLQADILRLKPAKRCLVSYICQDPDESRLRMLGKVRFKGLDRKARQITEHLLSHGLGQSHQSPETTAVIPRVYGELACWNMVLFEYLQGDALDPGLNGFALGLNGVGSPHARVADALCDLHETPVDSQNCMPLPWLTEHTVGDELEILRKNFVQFSGDWPQWSEQAWRIWYQLQAMAPRVQCQRRTLIHRDFYFDQVLLLPEDKIALLDLDLACLGAPELDAGNYIAHLRERAIRSSDSAEACWAAERAFTEQFLRRTDGKQHQLSFWILVSLARLAAISVRFPERVHTTEQLLEIVERGLLSIELR